MLWPKSQAYSSALAASATSSAMPRKVAYPSISDEGSSIAKPVGVWCLSTDVYRVPQHFARCHGEASLSTHNSPTTRLPIGHVRNPCPDSQGLCLKAFPTRSGSPVARYYITARRPVVSGHVTGVDKLNIQIRGPVVKRKSEKLRTVSDLCGADSCDFLHSSARGDARIGGFLTFSSLFFSSISSTRIAGQTIDTGNSLSFAMR